MKRNNYLLINVPLLFSIIFFSSFTNAAILLDQSGGLVTSRSTHGIGGTNDIERSQVFTVGMNGLLSQVDVYFDALLLGDGTNDLFMSVYATQSGVPLENALATGIFSGSIVTAPGWVSFDVSNYGVLASQGDVLAFSVGIDGQPNNSPLWSMPVSINNQYAGGNAYVRSTPLGIVNWTLQNSDYDMTFMTYMDTSVSSVPVPAAVYLFGSGLLGLFGVTRRKVRS